MEKLQSKYSRLEPPEEEGYSSYYNSSFPEKNPNKRPKLTRLLSLFILKDSSRTNNNRIQTILNLAFIYYFTLILLLPLPSPVDGDPWPVRISSSYAKTFDRNSNTTIETPSTINANTNKTQGISNKSYSSLMTSIDRPFYTKITSDDALVKPSHYVNSIKSTATTTKPTTTTIWTTTKTPKSRPNGSNYFIKKGSGGSSTPKSLTSAFASANTTEASTFNSIIASTESGPKIRLEPFFNLLTSFQNLALGTSKEQRFSPSYQTITQSINENTKKAKEKGAKKGTKGMRPQKKRNKNKFSGNLDPTNNGGPIPIPIPKTIVDPNDFEPHTTRRTLHPLDVLSLPVSDSSQGSQPDSAQAEYLKDFVSITNPNHGPFEATTKRNHVQSSSNWNSPGQNQTRSDMPESRERRLRSDNLDNFHDQDIDLLADESVPEGQHEPVVSKYNEHDTDDAPNAKSISDGRRHVNIPQGYTHPTEIQAAPGGSHKDNNWNFHFHDEDNKKRPNPPFGANPTNPFPKPTPPPRYSTIHSAVKKEEIDMVSKYPLSFAFNNNNDPLRMVGSQNKIRYQNPSNPIESGRPSVVSPYELTNPHVFNHNQNPKNSRLRPNLHSHYDPNHHNYGRPGENTAFSETTSGSHHYPSSGYGNPAPSFHNYGSHYSGHSLLPQPPRKPLSQKPNPEAHSSDQTNSDSDPATGVSSDLLQQGTSSDTSFDFDSLGSNSNQKIGLMSSFDLFYKEYKILTWAAVFVVTSLALLSVLLFLYVNSPPTEVVQARSYFDLVGDIMGNKQILKFLSNLTPEMVDKAVPGKRKKRRFKREEVNALGGSLVQIFNQIKKDL